MRNDCIETIHFFMVESNNGYVLPYDVDIAIAEIKEILNNKGKNGVIKTIRCDIEVDFFSLSGLNKLSPIMEKQLRDYLTKY